ncbi:hypothetical protein HAX54_032856, partial [Datura stramonium]|nr:hypothetical protein [Datura stramonium]
KKTRKAIEQTSLYKRIANWSTPGTTNEEYDKRVSKAPSRLLDHSSASGTTDPLPSIAAESFHGQGAKRSSLNQSVARSPESLIWQGKTALLWAQEVKGMSSAASPPHFFFYVPVKHALHTPLALCSPLILHWMVRMDFAVFIKIGW